MAKRRQRTRVAAKKRSAALKPNRSVTLEATVEEYIGLIWFTRAAAVRLGTSTAALARLSDQEQLDFVERHFRPFAGPLHAIDPLRPRTIDEVRLADESGGILRRGSTGPEVESLQDELIDFGHLRAEEKAGGPGIFGPRTERALTELQLANLLSPNGTLDAETHDSIRQINIGLAIGSRGRPVAALAERLVKLGNLTNADVAAAHGAFDEHTAAALRQFQRQSGLAPSGVMDVLTYRALLTAVPVSAPAVPVRGTDVDTVLPDSGRGFATFNRELGGADQFGRASTIVAIQSLGARWAEAHAVPIFVGDISRKGGGAFPPHASHRDGRDVDLRPFRHNGQPGATNIHDPSYSHALTRELVVLVREMFQDATILFNDPLLVGDGLTRPFAGHDNHLHLRLS